MNESITKNIWEFSGKALFYLAWPVLYVYFARVDRTRIVVHYQGNVVAVKGWIGQGKWSLPGGGIHGHERPVDAAIREIREETGIKLEETQLKHIGEADYRANKLHYHYHQFVCELGEPQLLMPQRLEVLATQWLSPSQLTTLTAEPDALATLAAWSQLVAKSAKL